MCDKCKDTADPCCYDGYCEANPTVAMCIHCGASMFEEDGYWYHHTQENIPLEIRIPQFVQLKDNKDDK